MGCAAVLGTDRGDEAVVTLGNADRDAGGCVATDALLEALVSDPERASAGVAVGAQIAPAVLGDDPGGVGQAEFSGGTGQLDVTPSLIVRFSGRVFASLRSL